jgi:hypothetical protein
MFDVNYFLQTINSENKGFQAVACNKITYIRTYKCASSFFYCNLKELYGWREIGLDQINWNEKVFSHIRNPLDRRHRGLAHYLYHNHPKMLDNDNIFEVMLDIPFFDSHSESYVSALGDYAYKIDWIPIDYYSENTVTKLTERLLNHCGQVLTKGLNPDFKNSTVTPEKLLYEKIKNHFEHKWRENVKNNVLRNFAFDRYFLKDLKLYKEIIEHFNPDGLTWPDSSWLRKNENKTN